MNADILKNWKFIAILGIALTLYAIWIMSEK